MATKTISSGESSRGFTFKLVMHETTDIETNTSSISWQLQLSLKSGSGWSFYDFGVGWEAYINGVRVAYHNRASSDRYTLTAGNTWTMASGTTSVVHDTDGTKTISCSASMDMATSPSGAGPLSCSGTWVLETIPRASSLTIPTLTIESSATLTITAASNTFTHEISYVMSDLSGTIATLGAGVSTTTWTPPNTFYAKIPNATQGNVTITLDTYTGATLIGSNSYTVPVLVGSSIKPTVPSVTLSPVNTNAWLSSQGLYVGGYTKVRVQSSASPGSGASITSYQISGAFSGTGSDYTSGVLTAGAKSITVTVTDSRGRSNTKTSSVTFLDYANPSLTTFTAERGTYSGGSWTSNVNGNHIRVTAIATVSLTGNTGTKSVTVGGTSPSATSGNYYYWTSTNNTTTYIASGTVTDSLGNSSSKTLTISTVEVPFNINVDLPGAAFGMIAQNPRLLELADTWSLEVGGEIRRDGVPVDIEFIRGTWASATNALTGVTKDSALYEGKKIILYYPYAANSSSATLNLTFADGTTTGAKNVYYNGTTRLTTHYGQYAQVEMIYHENFDIGGTNYTGWWCIADRTDLTAYNIRKNSGSYLAYNTVYRYMILFTKSEDQLLAANTTSNNTGTSKVLTTESFDPFGDIYYYSSTTTVSSGSAIGTTALYRQYNVNLRYSFNSGTTLTSNKAVYIICDPQSDGKVKLSTSPAPITQTLPSSADGKVYIYLGQASSTANCEIALNHPVYYYSNGAIRIWTNDDDFVIEDGTSGDWTYRKWNSGVAECWGIFDLTITGWSAWGNLQEATRSADLAPTYPTGLFNNVPMLNANVWSASIGMCGVELYGTHTSSQAPSIIPLRPNSGSIGTVKVYLTAKGTWI